MNFYPIFKKELRSYFSSLIAYVILTVFLIISGYYFYTDLALFVVWGGIQCSGGFMAVSVPRHTARITADDSPPHHAAFCRGKETGHH